MHEILEIVETVKCLKSLNCLMQKFLYLNLKEDRLKRRSSVESMG